ncbi:MAG TPA: glycosyl hydrolase family 8 [Candidatus Dormibacteraeota bacterium]|jgi:endoglucanase|nr:glycosyl hydrolase family 8 [Candidatus Dormibacteraeota bacterium]
MRSGGGQGGLSSAVARAWWVARGWWLARFEWQLADGRAADVARHLPRRGPLSSRGLWLALVVVPLTAVVHGLNMFAFPYYENDEATYMSQAWSLLNGKLAPYTYWYDHAPVGWVQIAAWVKLTGLYTFGTSIDSGRVLMLLFHVAAAVLVFRITLKLTGSEGTAALAAVLCAVTPLGVYYMRRVLLDNIMLVWVLLAVDLVLHHRGRLWRIVLSGVALAVAVLSKETALVFIPSVLALVWFWTARWQRRFAIVLWVTSLALVVAYYPAMALLKHELLPPGTLGDHGDHVSLVATFAWQMSRGGGGILNPATSLFWHAFARWWSLDPVFVVLGAAGIAVNAALARRVPSARWALVLAVPFVAYLMRGGLVLDFYVTPAIPLVAIAVAVAVRGVWVRTAPAWRSAPPRLAVRPGGLAGNASTGAATLGVLIAITGAGGYGHDLLVSHSARLLFSGDQTAIQDQATAALAALPPGAVVAMDDYGWLDLHVPKAGAAHPNDHWYWKLDRDPALTKGLLHDDPGRIDYVLLTPQVSADLSAGQAPMVSAALRNSQIVQRWSSDGYGIELWQSRTPAQILRLAWDSYKRDFILREGRVVDAQAGGITTSEGQAYAMLRAAWMGDRATFDRVWGWTSTRLAVRPDGLMAWRYGLRPDGTLGVLDSNTAADADEDLALALLFAGRRWQAPAYTRAATAMLPSIWSADVGYAAGRPYYLAGNWGNQGSRLVLNPSYIAPYAYRIFAAADPAHPWGDLVDSGYDFLDADATAAWGTANPAFLPTEWAGLDTATGRPVDVGDLVGGGSRWFSFGAARVPWRLSLDAAWNGETRATDYLRRMDLPAREWGTQGHLYATYDHDGTPVDRYETRSVIGAVLPAVAATSPRLAASLYQAKLFQSFDLRDGSYFWDDPGNYYEQNWAWFGTAAHAGALPTLWPIDQRDGRRL